MRTFIDFVVVVIGVICVYFYLGVRNSPSDLKPTTPESTVAENASSAAHAIQTPSPIKTLVKRHHILDSGLFGEKGAAIAPDGTVWVWDGDQSQAVWKSKEQRFTARQLTGIEGVVEISVGGCSIIALKDDASVWGTGCNSSSQLGDNVKDGRGLTKDWWPIEGINNAKQILANAKTALVLKQDGTVWAWGEDDAQLFDADIPRVGTAAIARVKKPVELPLQHVKEIAVMQSDVSWSGKLLTYFALRDDGSVLGWGAQEHLRPPNISGAKDFFPINQAMFIKELAGIKSLRLNHGGQTELILGKKDGTLMLWGDLYPTCGLQNNSVFTNRFVGVRSIAKGTNEIFIVASNGSFWRTEVKWDVENKNNICMSEPEQLLPAGSAIEVASTFRSNLLLSADGKVWAWGNNLQEYNHPEFGEILEFDKRMQIAGLPNMLTSASN